MESYFARNVPKEARGIFFALSLVFANIGRAICFYFGGVLFDVASYWPFIFIGLCCSSYGVILVILFSLGIYENRINKAQRHTII